MDWLEPRWVMESNGDVGPEGESFLAKSLAQLGPMMGLDKDVSFLVNVLSVTWEFQTLGATNASQLRALIVLVSVNRGR
jgi:hypothetical protein